MHIDLLRNISNILEAVELNSTKYDSAITNLADAVFKSEDFDEILSDMEDLFIHEGKSANFRFDFAVFYLLSVIYRRVCDRQKLQSLITLGATRFEDYIDFKLIYLS